MMPFSIDLQYHLKHKVATKISFVLTKQSDLIGLFLKVLSDNFSYKSCPNFWRLFDYLVIVKG